MLAGRFMRLGVPLMRVMAHLHVIGVDVIATVVWDGPGQVRNALAATAGTDDSPWRDKRADDSDPRPASDQAGHDNLENRLETFPARRTAPGPLVPTRGTRRLREFFLINIL
jgi:hypothetical protein